MMKEGQNDYPLAIKVDLSEGRTIWWMARYLQKTKSPQSNICY